MNISPAGINLICSFEGFVDHPYVDPASGGEPITIGYGTTHYPDGAKVTLQDTPITQEYGKECLANYVAKNIEPILNALPIPLNQNQFDGVCSFCYNEGIGNFNTSHLKLKIEADPNDPTITDEFNKWVWANHKVFEGLVARRSREAEYYFS